MQQWDGVQGHVEKIHECQMKTLNRNALSRNHVLASRRNALFGRNLPLDISFVLDLLFGEADSPVEFHLK